jgi:hypothetical protein
MKKKNDLAFFTNRGGKETKKIVKYKPTVLFEAKIFRFGS